jgi:hypothetical protein
LVAARADAVVPQVHGRSHVQSCDEDSLTGHKTRSVFKRYNITSSSDLEDIAQKLEAFMTRRPATLRLRR